MTDPIQLGKDRIPEEFKQTAVAVICSDLHFRETVPTSRGEADWYPVMKEYLDQLSRLVCQLGGVAVLYAGDVFDDGWRSRKVPPKLINFLVEHMPGGYAVPGQHDLPHHRYDAIKDSAYWTLVKTGTIKNLEPGKPQLIGNTKALWVTGFPWGFEPRPIERSVSDIPHVALIHKYVWTDGYSIPNAKTEERAAHYLPSLIGYDVAAFGDNHKGFSKRFVRNKSGGPPLTVFNCGHFIRRNSDEKPHYKPRVGIIHSDGLVTTAYLDTSDDVWADQPYNNEWEPLDHANNGFAEGMKHLAEVGVDFVEALRAAAAKSPPHVRAEITSILDSLR